MNLVPFEINLKTRRFVKPFDSQDLLFENLLDYNIIDSYDETWNEFTEENVAEALTHAKQEIVISNALSKERQRVHIIRACKDLSNYYLAINRLYNEYESIQINYVDKTELYEKWKRDAKKLIKALAYYEDMSIDKITTDYLRSVYKTVYPYCAFLPDYLDLYEEIGDIALFVKGDFHRAMIWYSLNRIEWCGLLDVEDEDLSSKQIERKQRWWHNLHDMLTIISDLSNDTIFHRQVVIDDNTIDVLARFSNLFQEYLYTWGNYEYGVEGKDGKKFLEVLSTLVLQVKEDIETVIVTEENKCKIRSEIMIVSILKDQALYYKLLEIAEDNDTIEEILKERQSKTVLKLLNQSKDDKLVPIKRFLECTAGSYNKRFLKVLGLVNAVSTCDSVLGILYSRAYSRKVAYYTKLDTLEKMLPDTADSEDNVGKLAIMHVAYMNDPNEGRILGQWIFRNQEKGRVVANYPYSFIKCFTTRIDDLPMWEMYGGHAEGCCLVLDLKKIMGINETLLPLYNVCYIRKSDTYSIETDDNREIGEKGVNEIRQCISKLDELFNQHNRDHYYINAMKVILDKIQYLFKNADYSYECEKRIIYTTENGLDKRIKHTKPKTVSETPMLYIQSDMSLCIDELILGPKFKDAYQRLPYLQERLDGINKKIGYKDSIKITYSGIEYK